VRKLNALHFEQILKKQKGTLSDLEKEVLDSFRDQDLLTENINEEFEERSKLTDRLSDNLAKFGGSWGFITVFIVVLVGWMVINASSYMRTDIVIFGILLLGTTGYLLDLAIVSLQHAIVPWAGRD